MLRFQIVLPPASTCTVDKDVLLRTCAIAGRMGLWPLQLDPPPQSFGLSDAVIV